MTSSKGSKDTADKFCRIKGIEEHNLLDELVLYFPERQKAFSFNSSAKAIWKLCDGRNTTVEITQKLAQQLGCSDAEVLSELLSDVETVIMQLHQHGLLTLVETPPTFSEMATKQ